MILLAVQRHRAVDAYFKDVMKKTAENPHCLTAGTAPGLMDNFRRNNEALEGIAKGLEEFLEVRAFPLSVLLVRSYINVEYSKTVTTCAHNLATLAASLLVTTSLKRR